jgi:hypothetical protein
MAAPWMKFRPEAWRADEKLRNCSLAARGLWVEMISIMHRSEKYGHLLVNGKPPTDHQLAVQAGASTSEVTALLEELEGEGVFSRAATGAIYSRRMTRDHKLAEDAKKTGRLGGNPTLCDKREKPAGVKGQDKAMDKAMDKGGDKATLNRRDERVEEREGESAQVLTKQSPEIPLPDDWSPEPFGAGSQSASIVASWPAERLALEAEKFRAHHTANGTRWRNWQAAWSKWVLNAGPSQASQAPAGSFLRIVQDELAREKQATGNG